jgi:hypothetical protein
MTLKYTADQTETTVLDNTALASLGSGSNKITTSAVSNSASGERWPKAKFKLNLGVTSARTAGDHVDLYAIPILGTEYAYGGDSLDPDPAHLVGSFTFDAATNARDDVIVCDIPPNDFHVLVINNLSVAFGASNNTLGIAFFSFEDA